MRKYSVIVLLWNLFLIPACSSNSLEPSRVEIYSADNNANIADFEVEIVDDPSERAMGLMYRTELDKDKGMLFIYQKPSMGSFWMKNTLIPLDMIFIGEDKKIVSIVKNAEPQTLTSRSPEGPYLYVLEINGGLSDELGIEPNDWVEMKLSKN